MNLIASKLGAHEFFVGAQRCGLAVGVVYSPEEVMDDPHFAERGFRVEVEHADLGRSFSYPGAPWIFHATPWQISRRAPHLGEHNERVFGLPDLPDLGERGAPGDPPDSRGSPAPKAKR